MTVRFSIPTFKPHPFLRNGHAQTLAGVYLPSGRFGEDAVQRRVPLPDGDTVVLHDDLPVAWRPSDRTALLLHGLAGCHQSSYMLRIARKLVQHGVRTFRMDLRGCGAGEGLASRPYHAGRSEDARSVLEYLQTLCPGSPVTIVGFSLSGNIVLKLVGESPQGVPINVEKAAAVCPSLDLSLCARSLVGPVQKLYERHFVWLLCRQIESNRRLRPEVPALVSRRRPKTLLAFDDIYTGPVCGFGTAENYYSTNSARRHVAHIRLPTLILTAEDDPLVPSASFHGLEPSSSVLFHQTEHGGHLGYVGKPGVDADLHWMDWRIVDWITTDLAPEPFARAASPSRVMAIDSPAVTLL
jgi:uncharacterized protein